MSGVYSMSGPTYQGASRLALFDAAMAQPLSIGSTLMDQAKGGVLESFGLGTVLRSTQLPEAAPTEEGVLVGPEDSQTAVPNTRTLQRRMTAFGDLTNARPETSPELEQRRTEMKALDESAYKASPWFRQNIPWDAGMTETRAAALASMDDAKKVREFYAEKRPFSAFIGNLAGQAIDPINYIPIFGEAVQLAAVAKAGRIVGRALVGGLDAAANTAIFGMGTADQRAQFGDDVSWQSTVSQIATAALLGSAFGAVGGAIGRRVEARTVAEAERRLGTLRTTQEARIALNEGIDAVVRGEDIKLSPNATEPMARVAGEIEKTTPPPQTEATIALARSDADAVLQSVGFDLKALAVQGRDINTVMRAASAEEAAKAVQTQEIASLKERLADMQAEQPVENTYGPGLLRAPNAEPTAQVYDRGMGGAVTAEERAADIRTATEKLATIEAHAAQGTVAPEYVEAIEFGRKNAAPVEPSIVPRETAPPRADTTAARPDPSPEGIQQAAAAIAKAEDVKALAAQYRVDPQTGAFDEEGEVAQLAAEGRLMEDDVATLTQAQADFEAGAAYAEALKSVAGCLL